MVGTNRRRAVLSGLHGAPELLRMIVMPFDMTPSRRSVLALLGLGSGAAVLASCGSNGEGGGGSSDGGGSGGGALDIVTSNYPMTYLVTAIGGDRVTLTDLATPGADPHGLELSVQQTMAVQEADLVLQIPGYQLALDDAVASGKADNALDVSGVIEMLPSDGAEHDHDHGDDHDEHDHDEHDHDHEHDEHDHEHDEHDHEDDAHDDEHDDHEHDDHEGHDHGPNDPHMWHDPLRMAQVGEALAAKLGELDPEGAETYQQAAADLRTELEELDAELTELYQKSSGERTFITSHAAYAYLAERYDLHQVGIAGVDPETEPSPQRLLELEELIKAEGVDTIFFETTASPKVAQTLADNAGVASEELDNLETQLDQAKDYPAVMRENANKLVDSWS